MECSGATAPRTLPTVTGQVKNGEAVDETTRKLIEQAERFRSLNESVVPAHLRRHIEEMNRLSEIARPIGALAQFRELADLRASFDPVLELASERARELFVFQKYTDIGRAFEQMTGITSHAGIQRALEGFEKFGRQIVPDDATIRLLQEATAKIHESFRLPEMGEFAKLHDKIAGLSSLNSFGLDVAQIQAAMDSVRSPWVNKLRVLESFEGFTDLSALGKAIRSAPYELPTVERIRHILGDWSELPGGVADDALGREEVYLERGMDTGIIAIPEPAFTESLNATHVVSIELLLPDADTFEFEVEQQLPREGEALFRRAERARSLVARFEEAVRRYLLAVMTQKYGPRWEKERTPENGKMFDRWNEKRERAIKNGEQSYELIYYADFTDYCSIITKGDNWKELFSPVFRDADTIRVSFRRIEPVRVAVMHSRPISKGDLLYLATEITHVLTAIGVLKKL